MLLLATFIYWIDFKKQGTILKVIIFLIDLNVFSVIDAPGNVVTVSFSFNHKLLPFSVFSVFLYSVFSISPFFGFENKNKGEANLV